jgi:hypothetical protein
MFTAFRTLTLITTPLLPLLLKTLSERSAFRLSLRGTPVFPLLLKQFSPNLETEAEAILTLLIKLIGGKTGWLTPVSFGLPGWMRVLVMEIMRMYASLYTSFLTHWLIGDYAVLYPYIYAQAL